MYLASVSSMPSAPVLLTRSEPARSTRFSRERRITSEPGAFDSTVTMKMQCEREEARFIGVSAIMRLVSPMKSRFSASSSVLACLRLRLRILTLPSSSSASCTFGRSSSFESSFESSSRS